MHEVILWWPLNLLIETSCLWIFSVISMSDMSDLEKEILVSPSRQPPMTINWNHNNYIQLHPIVAVKPSYIVNMHQCFFLVVILAATNSAPLFTAVCFEEPMSTYSVNTDVSYKVFAAITSCHSLMVYSKHLWTKNLHFSKLISLNRFEHKNNVN